MNASLPSQASRTFGETAAIRCERAAAELRAGRPVVVTGGQRRLATLALDSASPAGYAAFAAAADGRHYLFLTAPRARTLGLDTAHGIRIALAGHDFAQLPALAWLRDATAPQDGLHEGDDLDDAATEIARLGLLLPALISVELPAGATPFDGCLQLALADLRSGATQAGQDYELVTRSPVPLRDIGMTEFAVFRGGVAQRDQVAVIVGTPDMAGAVPVRVHSSCLTGDLFGSLKCDCGDQLRRGLRTLKELGGGILLYLDQEGRGTGIAAKMRAYGYQHEGLDTIDADAQLGFGADERRYGSAVAMLRALGVQRIQLLTNNPTKVQHLRNAGIEVLGCVPVTGEITAENEHYLRTKATRAGHHLDVDALIMAAQ
ncbi:GTP cyclohydrolase II RibA [Stenotrophomonas sp. NLF4-10]|uniref:GTP cyclohydrolase II RibA n=1 Tax=Stenotrophomonas sp. NLF4-10 TaxID=2918754 RepID=UPI001EFB28E7|nr:GTP cyclohydrolase II RibA [Stenotrophomonas sp. NLF4-10]MCG8277955.1 GTP cyclohydrolase II RibA [Stenotrophomonas sp. NLF4-10]